MRGATGPTTGDALNIRRGLALAATLVPWGLLLGGAAAPPGGCPAVPLHGQTQTMPMPMELGGRPSGPSDLASAGTPIVPAGACAGAAAPGAAVSSSFKDDRSDILHGLPLPDILKPPGDNHGMRPEFGN